MLVLSFYSLKLDYILPYRKQKGTLLFQLNVSVMMTAVISRKLEKLEQNSGDLPDWRGNFDRPQNSTKNPKSHQPICL